MAIYIFFYLINLCFSSNDLQIIRDLNFNEFHIENLAVYDDHMLPKNTEYYIRFPNNYNKNITFFLTLPKYTPYIFLYFAEFSSYPTNDDISLADNSFFQQLSLTPRDDSYYDIYSANIFFKQPYIILYFKNSEPLSYLSLYASSQIPFHDIDCNYNFESKNIEPGEKLNFRVNIIKYSGSEMTIKLILKGNFYNSDFVLNAESFSEYPEEDMLYYSDYLKTDLKGKASYENNRTIIEYIFKTKKDDNYLNIQLESKKSLEYLGVIVIPKIDNIPTWILIVISIIVVIIFIACVIVISVNEKARSHCHCLFVICFCFQICTRLSRAIK